MEDPDDETLHVRDAVMEDVEALLHLKPSAAVHRDRIRDAATSMMRYLVLEREGRVIGFALLVFARPPHWSDGNDASRLPQAVDLVIAPDLRGRGYGTFFLKGVERLAAERGFRQLYLAVDPLDNPRAHALYMRRGYKPLQAEPYRSHWEFVDSAGELHQGEEWSLDMVKSLEQSAPDGKADRVSLSAYVITVSGVSGSGKSSTVRAIANRLGNASCFYFDDYGEGMQQPDDGLRWIVEGADLTEFVLPHFGADLQRLKQGETVTTPTGRRVEPAAFLVVEEPFGNGRRDMAGLVDFSVCIDAPMEIALARRLLDVVGRWEGPAEQRLQWINGYLKSYLFEGMREVYIAINERVKANAQMILDGTLPVEQNAQAVVKTVMNL